MPNIKIYIDRHNSKLIKQENSENNNNIDICNCLPSRKQDCPLPGRCTAANVVYRASVERLDNGNVETYTGVTEHFKPRYTKHSSDFKHRAQRKSTKLSSHIWKLKDLDVPYNTTWDIIARAPSFNPTTKICRLCLTEVYHIMWSKEGATLNKRNELFGHCRHRKKHLLIKPES